MDKDLLAALLAGSLMERSDSRQVLGQLSDLQQNVAGLRISVQLESSSSDSEDMTGEYVRKWKVAKDEVEIKMKELLKEFRKIKEAGVDLLDTPTKYNAQLQLFLSAALRQQHNPLLSNRRKFLDALLNEGICQVLITYWERIRVRVIDRNHWEKIKTADAKLGQSALNFGKALMVLWQGSDFGNPEQIETISEDLVPFIANQLGCSILSDEVTEIANHPQHLIVNSLLRIMYNMCRKSLEASDKIKEVGGLAIFTKLLSSWKDDNIGTNSFLILALITSPNDHETMDLLMTKEKQMKTVVKQFMKAVNEQDHCTSQYSLVELLPAVNSLLKLSHTLQAELLQQGILPSYLAMLDKNFSTLANKMAIQGLESLCASSDKMVVKHITARTNDIRQLAMAARKLSDVCRNVQENSEAVED